MSATNANIPFPIPTSTVLVHRSPAPFTMRFTMPNDLPLSTILQTFEYNLAEGTLFWKNPKSRKLKPGAVAGTINSQGYIQIQYNRVIYRAHRLLFTIHAGRTPNGEIDHIDGNRVNNSISNLREVTKTENVRNSRLQFRNNTGVIGVMQTANGKYEARITVNNRSIYLGRYTTLAEATAVRQAASLRHHFHRNHGNF